MKKKSPSLEFEARAKELFTASVGTSKLLVDLESVELDGDKATVIVGVNATAERGKRLVKHRVIDQPVRRFITELRAAVPATTITLSFLPVPMGDRSLAIGLRHAGAPELVEELGVKPGAPET